jgi:hypothetical protein
MSARTLPEPEQLVAGFAEGRRRMRMAGCRSALDAFQTYAQTAFALADSQEKLAATSELEWLSRLLQAQAIFTREVAEASERFARSLMDA